MDTYSIFMQNYNWGIVIAILIFVIFATGCVGTSSEQKVVVATNPTIDIHKTSTARYTTQTTTSVPSVPTEVDLTIGQTASNPQKQVIVYSAQIIPSYTWKGISQSYTYTQKPSTGNTFILVDTEVKNIGSDRMYASAGDFSVSDSDGNRYDTTMYYGDDGLGYLKELYQNQKTRGKVIFEVPTGSKQLKLYYDFGNLFSGTQLASWKIN